MEKVIPSQGEGEQSTKLGGPWPYCPQPPLRCTFENELPPVVVVLVPVGLDSVWELPTGAEFVPHATSHASDNRNNIDALR